MDRHKQTGNYSITENSLTTVSEGPARGFQLLFLRDREEAEHCEKTDRLKRVDFHVHSDDYFGTAATVIDYIAQESAMEPGYRLVLKNIKNDMLYLQDNYRIVKK
ncbi:MAG: hypothetical protein V1867_08060 [Candidatus Falkowbacteria bacterium]